MLSNYFEELTVNNKLNENRQERESSHYYYFFIIKKRHTFRHVLLSKTNYLALNLDKERCKHERQCAE
jgi:hypothetical protein